MEKREIVKALDAYNNTHYAAITWNIGNKVGIHELKVFEPYEFFTNRIEANNFVEQLYKKWLIGEEFNFPEKITIVEWDSAKDPNITVFGNVDRNEYLRKQARRILRENYSIKNYEKMLAEFKFDTTNKTASDIYEFWKKCDEQLKIANNKGKECAKNDTVDIDAITNEHNFALREILNEIFVQFKNIKENSSNEFYNTLAPKVEAAFVQANKASSFKETREDLIALQKEIFSSDMERWQKNELINRLQECFNIIKKREDEYYSNQNMMLANNFEKISARFDKDIPEALGLNFSQGFALLKELGELYRSMKLTKEDREVLHKRIDEAFEKIKLKAEEETKENEIIAKQEMEIGLQAYKQAQLFKDKRAILIDVQNKIKELKLSRESKDKFFGELRTIFNELNEQQDEYFKNREKEKLGKLDTVVTSLKIVLARKKEGVTRLYSTKTGLEEKIQMIRPSKNSSNGLSNQFQERLNEINDKIKKAEKDITDLEKKIKKIETDIGTISEK